MFHLTLSGLGAIEPFGQPQFRQQLFGDLHHGRLGHRRPTLGDGLVVFLADPLTYGTHTLQG